MMRKKWSSGLAGFGCACGLLLAMATAPAQATAILTVSDGVNSRTLTDGGTGQIVFDSLHDATWGSTSSWVITIDTGLTKPYLGSTEYPDMHLSVLGFGVGDLSLNFFDDGFFAKGPVVDLVTRVGGVVGDGGSVTAGSASTAGSLASFGPWDSGAFSAGKSTWQDLTGSYGLDLWATISHQQWSASSFDASIQVPEPATFALFGAGLLGCVIFVGRRRVPAR